MRWLSEHKDVRVGTVVLVAPWLNPTDNSQSDTDDFFKFEIDPQLASRTAGVTIFNSDNDFKVIQASVRIIRDAVEDVQYREFHGYGHFCLEDMKTTAFPELREVCLR